MKDAAVIAIDAVTKHLNRDESNVSEVLFVLFDKRTYDIYVNQIR